ncbi:MAG TPA: DUF1565 domain-containing protein, partial [Polyangiales bacterium]|nr:DUF1565 domain-containing protein [Polyangiales bacterium]
MLNDVALRDRGGVGCHRPLYILPLRGQPLARRRGIVETRAHPSAASWLTDVRRPVKTITHALELVGMRGAGRTVVLLDGTYDAPGGERFPLTVPTTITLAGISTVNAETIEVSAAASSETARILGEGALVTMAPGSTLSHVIVISQGTSSAALDIDGATYGVHLNDVFSYGT